MLVLALLVLTGVLIALLAGGDLRRWHTNKLDYGFPACIALLLQLVIFNPPLERMPLLITYGPLVYLASMLVILIVIVLNARAQPGLGHSLALGAAAVGVALNCAVVAANGGYMPRATLADRADLVSPADTGRLVNIAPVSSATQLAWLGDVIEQPTWLPLSNVLSIGDLLLAGGLGSWAFAVTLEGVRPRWQRFPPEAEVPCRERSPSI